MNTQISIDGLPPKEPSPDKKQKKSWEDGFQRWSNNQLQNETTPIGKCGYSVICDYCEDLGRGRPCVRALNEYLRERHKTIDYTKKNYEDIWNL